MEDLEPIDHQILRTIEELSTKQGGSSHRGVRPEEIKEKLNLNDRDYIDRVEYLELRGFLEVSTGEVAILTSKGRSVFQESGKPKNEVAISNASSLLETIREYISKEYKISPVKTTASALTIIVLISGFSLFLIDNLLHQDTSIPPTIAPLPNFRLESDIPNEAATIGNQIIWRITGPDEVPVLYMFSLYAPNRTCIYQTNWTTEYYWVWDTRRLLAGDYQIRGCIKANDGREATTISKCVTKHFKLSNDLENT